MRRTQKSGFTLIELLVVVAIIALLISILLPSLARARELSKRTVCAANVKGIGIGFASYGTGNNDMWPNVRHKTTTSYDTSTGIGFVTYVAMVGKSRTETDMQSLSALTDTEVNSNALAANFSTVRNFWTLIRSGASSQKAFICPSSDDKPNTDENPQDFYDFGKAGETAVGSVDYYAQCSYGYQVPYGPRGSQPSGDVDPAMALVSDKGPWSAAAEGGKTPAPSTTVLAGLTSNNGPDDWKKFNSPNHGGMGDGEGQNVMYADGHAEFFMTPMAGAGRDNIFTRWTENKPTGDYYTNRIQGTPVTTSAKTLIPYGDTDSLIYP